MEHQDVLLILLGTIVVVIAISIGVTMFTNNSVNMQRDAIRSDLAVLAAKAQEFYRRPAPLDGGGDSFDLLTANSITLLTDTPRNRNGSYFVETAGSGSGSNALVVIKGVGTNVHHGAPVAAHVFVYPDHDSIVTVN
jgi:hypothetical protein